MATDTDGGTLTLTAVPLPIHTGSHEIFVHPEDAASLGVLPLDRVRLRLPDAPHDHPGIVNIAAELVPRGAVGISTELVARLGLKEAGVQVDIRVVPKLRSVELIRRKLDGIPLEPGEVRGIMHDIAAGHLTLTEMTAWACAVHVRGMGLEETVACVKAMVETGERISFPDGPVLDVHSIGGVPGNSYAPIAVSIVAAHGIRIPKTSSRAISSACGTADFMEVLAPVSLSAAKIRDITERVGGVLAWGGGMSLAPADDEIIRVEYPLGIDPPAQMVASVLAKKAAVGATLALIDLPVGAGGKVRDPEQARRLAHDFSAVGRAIGLRVETILTRADTPVGRAIGPVLEAREVLSILEGRPTSPALVEKALLVAGRLLEMAGKAKPGHGLELAQAALEDGRAHRKFMEIVRAQGATREMKASDLHPGPLTVDVPAPAAGTVHHIECRALVRIARALGSPRDHGAGLISYVRPGDVVKAGQPILSLYAEREHRLQDGLRIATSQPAIRFEARETA